MLGPHNYNIQYAVKNDSLAWLLIKEPKSHFDYRYTIHRHKSYIRAGQT